MASIWDEVHELVREGKTGFTVNLTPGQKVLGKRRQGRPRVIEDSSRPYAHYADPRIRLTNGRVKPRCVREGCTKKLKRDDVLVCSDECAELEVAKYTERLSILAKRGELVEAGKTKRNPGPAPKRERPRGEKGRADASQRSGRPASTGTRRKTRAEFKSFRPIRKSIVIPVDENPQGPAGNGEQV